MREPKFRIWDVLNKRMYNTVDPESIAAQAFVATAFDVPIARVEHAGLRQLLSEALENKQFIFLQYTGLKAKNGQEIYEGDIVVYVTPWGSRNMTKRRAIHWVTSSSITGFNITAGDNYEILGNIYENPELFKALED